jgi:drug/metabolite transporter (DMT)-like permease
VGPTFCLASAAGFGLMAVFAKLAYAEGVAVDGLLVVRFGLAGTILLLVSAVTGALRRLNRRAVVAALGMGMFGYAAQSGLYLGAVSQVDASQVALVFCVYPVLVMVASIAIGRERCSRQRLVALAIALAGVVLVLGGAATGSFDPVGALLSFSSALVYCAYILVGDRVGDDAPPVPLASLVCVGAFASWLAVSITRGGPALNVGVTAWEWLTALALVSTVGAILLFFAGMSLVGPTVASLLSIVEPVVTVVSAALVFGEGLSVLQAVGGVLVLGAVAVVQWPPRRPARHDGTWDRTEPPVEVSSTV